MVFAVPNRMAGSASSWRAIDDDKVGAGDRAKMPYNATRIVVVAVRQVHSGKILKFWCSKNGLSLRRSSLLEFQIEKNFNLLKLRYFKLALHCYFLFHITLKYFKQTYILYLYLNY